MLIVDIIEHIVVFTFKEDCPYWLQMLFAVALGGATGIVLAYIGFELVRYLKE